MDVLTLTASTPAALTLTALALGLPTAAVAAVRALWSP